MSTPRMKSDPLMTRYMVSEGIFCNENFCLFDVGASCGIEQHWHIFRPFLRAYGFEPFLKETERLNRESPDPNIRYFSYFVSSSDKSDMPVRKNLRKNPWNRLVSGRAMEIMSVNYAKTYHDSSGKGEVTTNTITLDGFYKSHALDVDFIKTDTDGHDYLVLRGAENLLSSRVLGVFVEFDFHNENNSFTLIDDFLCGLGFSLFDIEVYRYSRSVLPRPFVHQIPAQTQGGQVIWGDALYIRDTADQDYYNMWKFDLSPVKALKLACIFELFGLEDCAAEVLTFHKEKISPLINVDKCLDLLTPPLNGIKLTFKDYNLKFEKEINAFFPNYKWMKPNNSIASNIINKMVNMGLRNKETILKIPLIGSIAKKIHHRMMRGV